MFDRLSRDPKVCVSVLTGTLRYVLNWISIPLSRKFNSSLVMSLVFLALSGVTASNSRCYVQWEGVKGGVKSLTTFSSHFTLRCFTSTCTVELLKLLLTCKDTTAFPLPLLRFTTVDCPFTIVVYLLIINLTCPWNLE